MREFIIRAIQQKIELNERERGVLSLSLSRDLVRTIQAAYPFDSLRMITSKRSFAQRNREWVGKSGDTEKNEMD